MDNRNFLKSINILYVEDDEEISFRINSILEKICNNVIVANNGQEGVDKFIEAKNNDIAIDVIITDINMPKKNGLAMIEEIKEIDDEVPFILTTAYSNSEFLLKAINFGVVHYAVKPIDLQELIVQIQNVCETRLKLKMIKHKNDELLEYLHLIDQVAIVSKLDLDGNYTFVNDIFSQISGYSEKEIIGQNKDKIMHSDMPKVVYSEILDIIKSGHKWTGKLKNKNKDDKDFFTKTTIIPNYDINRGGIVEYVEISFLITVDEQEKRDFRKKVIQNIQESKRQNYVARKMIDDLQEKLKNYQHFDILEETLLKERESTRKFKRQSKYYEIQLDIVNKDKENIKTESNKNVQNIAKQLSLVKHKKDLYYSKAGELKEELLKRVEYCDTLNKRIKDQTKMIRDLRDVIDHRENQLDNKRKKIA